MWDHFFPLLFPKDSESLKILDIRLRKVGAKRRLNGSTDTTVGWTKNTQKPKFFEKRKKSSKTQKLKNVWRYAKISNKPFDQRSLIHREAWFSTCFVRQNQKKKKTIFCAAILDHFQTKMFKCETTSFPKDFESLKLFDIWLREVGAKIRLNGSTDTTVGWTKNTQKPNVFEKRKKSSKTQKLKNV